jgi:hypothetical protein
MEPTRRLIPEAYPMPPEFPKCYGRILGPAVVEGRDGRETRRSGPLRAPWTPELGSRPTPLDECIGKTL